MTIDKSERAAVNKVIEALGDRATPAPRFDEFEVPLPAQSHRWTAAPLAVAAAVVALMVIGALLLRDPDDDLIRQTTVAQPDDGQPAPTSDRFVPPRFAMGDRVMYPVAMLDGTRIAMWLPASAGFDATGYAQSVGLEAVAGDLPSIRVDVTACSDCGGEFSRQYDQWALTATGDGINGSAWTQYTAHRIEPSFTADGYLTVGGDVIIDPIDGPGAVLTSGVVSISGFTRPCDDRDADFSTDAGLAVTFVEAVGVYQLCMPSQQLEVSLPGSFSRAELELVELELLHVGPLAAQARRADDLAPFTGPMQIGDVVVTSAGSRDSGIIRAYSADTYEPRWTVSTLDTSASILGASDDVVIVGGHFGPVLALDQAGSILWRVELDGDGEAPGTVAFNIDETIMYLPTSYTQEGTFEPPAVRAVDMATGDDLWRRSLIAGTQLQHARPTVTDSLVLVADLLSYLDSAYDGAVEPSTQRVHAIDRSTGELVWQYEFGEREAGMHNRAILATDEVAFTTAKDTTIVALNLEDGDELWRARSGSMSDVWIPLELIGDMLVSGDTCLNAQTGERVKCQRGIRGVLPNGQGYLIQSTPELAGEYSGISAGIILDHDEGEAEPLGGAVVGIITFDFAQSGDRTVAEGNRVAVVSGGVVMNIEIYHDVAERLGDDAGAKLLSMIVPRPAQPGSDLPSFVLEPPLRWATDEELPLHMMVQYSDFVVRRGCSVSAVACSDDDRLEVVPIEVVAGPPRPWPGNDVSISTVDQVATPD